ncbi:hypothetical protein 000TH008_37 [Bacillus phage 000TH008]|nr:hypothetical protein 000TH008_37 [Bacillus phage 000TH008]QQO40731.1 hypothetical protein 000TH009_37 [Bacillus phage 000TH009]
MENVKKYLLENMEELEDVVREINCWSADLDHLDFEENDEEFFKVHFRDDPQKAVRAVCFGDYNYSDEYVRFDGYGNLESFTSWQVEEELKSSIDDIIDALENTKDNLNLSDELQELLKEEEEEEE